MKPIEVRLVGRFRFHSRIEGEHQTLLYRAIHSQTGEPLVLKGEEVKSTKVKRGSLSLLQEGKIYQTMQGGIGIPYMHWCGQQEDYNFIAIQQLEDTLTRKIVLCGGKLAVKSALMVGLELLTIFQYFHFKYFIYNNLQPRHVMIGRGEKYGKFFLIDFNRASRYKDAQTSQHLEQIQEKGAEMRNHNMQFSSVNYHKGMMPSRRDDLETLLYLILFMLKGQLPWSHQARNMKKTDYQKSRSIIELKLSNNDTLFHEFPELQALYHYTTGLKFEEKPQYSYYASTFSHMMEKRGLIQDKVYDWMLLDDESDPEELTHHFELFAGEDQFIQKVSGQGIVGGDKIGKSTKIAEKGGSKGKSKSEKQCQIY